MIAIEALWTDRFQRLRGLRNVPFDTRSNPTQMIASARTMPSSRVSTSRRLAVARTGASVARIESTAERTPAPGRPSAIGPLGTDGPLTVLLRSPARLNYDAPCPARAGQGASLMRGASASIAGGVLSSGDALAEVRLGDPPGVEDVLQIGGRDRVRLEQDRGHGVPARRLERGGPGDLAEVGALAELHRSLSGALPEGPGVLPDVDGLRAERDPVQSGLVAVLAGHRHLAGESLRGEGRDDPAGHAVVLRQHRVDGVLVRGQELLHLRLSLGGVPVVGVGLADDLDGARLDGVTDHLLHAAPEEVGVRVGPV